MAAQRGVFTSGLLLRQYWRGDVHELAEEKTNSRTGEKLRKPRRRFVFRKDEGSNGNYKVRVNGLLFIGPQIHDIYLTFRMNGRRQTAWTLINYSNTCVYTDKLEYSLRPTKHVTMGYVPVKVVYI
jgi:hypothetical protein